MITQVCHNLKNTTNKIATWSCKRLSKLRLENESSTLTIIEESSWSICWSELITVLLFWSPMISGSDPIISFFKGRGQIDKACNSFSANASESTRKSSHWNWFNISLATSSFRHDDEGSQTPSLGYKSKYSGSFSSNMYRRSSWTERTSKRTRTRLSLLTEPKPSREEGSKTLYL